MPASLQVIIRYGGSKYEKLASGTLSQEAAIQLLLKDLRKLRANLPAQDNIKHVKGKFHLAWKSAGGRQDKVRKRPLCDSDAHDTTMLRSSPCTTHGSNSPR